MGPNEACPRPEFLALADDPDVVHVSLEGGGDGSATSPTTLSAAVSGGATRIALHAGIYENPQWPMGAEVVGRCTQEVIVRTPQPFAYKPAAIGGVTLELTPGDVKTNDLDVVLEDVLIRTGEPGWATWSLQQGTLEARRVHLSQVGLALLGTAATLDRVVSAQATNTPIRVADGADVRITRSVIGELALNQETPPRALQIVDATVELEDTVVHGCPEACIVAEGASLTLKTSWIGSGEAAISTKAGSQRGQLTLEDTTISAVEFGLIVRGPELHVTYSAFTDFRAASGTDQQPTALVLIGDPEALSGPSPTAIIESSVFRRNRSRSVLVAGYDTTLSGSRLEETDILLAAGTHGATVLLADSELRALGAAVVANLPDAPNTPLDVTVQRTTIEQSLDAPPGYPAVAALGSGVKLTVRESRLSGGAGPALTSENAGAISAQDNTIAVEGYAGPAVALHCDQGSVDFRRNRVAGTGNGVALARCDGAVLEANEVIGAVTGLLVCRTRGVQVIENLVHQGSGAADVVAVMAVGNADLELRDNQLSGSDGRGLAVYGGTATASGNLITENLAGGILIHDGAHLTLAPPYNRVVNNRGVGLDCTAGQVTASPNALDVQQTARLAKDGTLAHGVLLRQDCHVSLDAIAASDNACADIVADAATGTLTLAEPCQSTTWAPTAAATKLHPPPHAALHPPNTCPLPPPTSSWTTQPEQGPCAHHPGDP